MIRRIKNKKALDVHDYINMETGEMLDSELKSKNSKITITEETDLVAINSDDYVGLDTKATMYLIQELSSSDVTKVLQLSLTLKTDMNVSYNNKIPHTLNTLSKLLNISKDEVTKLVKRLYKKGIFGKFMVYKEGRDHTLYIMNPFLAKKRVTFDNKCLELFTPLIPERQ